jgi:hypothetical protein
MSKESRPAAQGDGWGLILQYLLFLLVSFLFCPLKNVSYDYRLKTGQHKLQCPVYHRTLPQPASPISSSLPPHAIPPLATLSRVRPGKLEAGNPRVDVYYRSGYRKGWPSRQTVKGRPSKRVRDERR